VGSKGRVVVLGAGSSGEHFVGALRRLDPPGAPRHLLGAPWEAGCGTWQNGAKNPQIAATIADLQKTDSGIGYGALRSNLCGAGTSLLSGVDVGPMSDAQYGTLYIVAVPRFSRSAVTRFDLP